MPGDRPVWPKQWPEEIGLACLWNGQKIIGVLPVHVNEEGEDLLGRLARDLVGFGASATCYPKMPGRREADLSIDEDEIISQALGVYLVVNPHQVEDAHDFAVNYEFVESSGMDFEALDGAAEAKAEGGVSAPASRSGGVPAGYGRYDPSEAINESFKGAYLRSNAEGHAEIVLPAFEEDGRTASVEILLRDDGLSLAIDVDQLLGLGAPPGVIVLPDGCLGGLAPSADEVVSVCAVLREKFLFVTPLWHSRSLLPATPEAERSKSGVAAFFAQLFRRVLLALALLLMLAVGVYLATAGLDETGPMEAISASPVGELKDMMFSDDQ